MHTRSLNPVSPRLSAIPFVTNERCDPVSNKHMTFVQLPFGAYKYALAVCKYVLSRVSFVLLAHTLTAFDGSLTSIGVVSGLFSLRSSPCGVQFSSAALTFLSSESSRCNPTEVTFLEL
ncbi:hypothetical protein T08_7693 [Trichinella sp. T8]|nr:hypothetical protein T08_15990 [Trichinella sp. T8]KRZ81739.1 hypothetical protein T08_7693 [Trichinella sp. T8]